MVDRAVGRATRRADALQQARRRGGAVTRSRRPREQERALIVAAAAQFSAAMSRWKSSFVQATTRRSPRRSKRARRSATAAPARALGGPGEGARALRSPTRRTRRGPPPSRTRRPSSSASAWPRRPTSTRRSARSRSSSRRAHKYIYSGARARNFAAPRVAREPAPPAAARPHCALRRRGAGSASRRSSLTTFSPQMAPGGDEKSRPGVDHEDGLGEVSGQSRAGMGIRDLSPENSIQSARARDFARRRRAQRDAPSRER